MFIYVKNEKKWLHYNQKSILEELKNLMKTFGK